MKARTNVRQGNTILFRVDEYRSGDIDIMGGQVLYVSSKGAKVVYLSGYRSRNDFIPWKDIIAKVDRRRKYAKVPGTPYSGKFEVYG